MLWRFDGIAKITAAARDISNIEPIVTGQVSGTKRQPRAVNCPNEVSKAIGGWSEGNDVSSSYGLGYGLEMKRKWLTKAYEWSDPTL